jgi:hypothetical protein
LAWYTRAPANLALSAALPPAAAAVVQPARPRQRRLARCSTRSNAHAQARNRRGLEWRLQTSTVHGSWGEKRMRISYRMHISRRRRGASISPARRNRRAMNPSYRGTYARAGMAPGQHAAALASVYSSNPRPGRSTGITQPASSAHGSQTAPPPASQPFRHLRQELRPMSCPRRLPPAEAG